MSSNETFETDIVDISEFFSGGDSSSFNEKESESKSTVNEIDSPIKELKAIILSLDWEITDEIADSFVAEVDYLLDVWKADKTVLSFLQILRALGKYLRTHKADAHPESIHLLYSVYNHFEKIVLTDEITAEEEQQILKDELEKFKLLKEKIALAAAAASEGKANEHLLSALKTILLEIDWQITDQTMQKFNLEITKLEQIWSSDKNFLTPLQMMRAIGSYINKNKLDSHPDSIKLLSTVFQHFEQMALTEEMSPEEQQELIQADLERFSQLKSQILSAKNAPPSEVFIESEAKETIASQMDLPAQARDYDDEDGSEDDYGYVEPLVVDADGEIPIETLAGETDSAGTEVDLRLNDLFSSSDNDLADAELTTLPPSPADSEIDGRLDALFEENDQGLPSDATNLPPIPAQEESTPMPATDDQFIDLSDSTAPLPPGQMSDEIAQDQNDLGTGAITPLTSGPSVEPLPDSPQPLTPPPVEEAPPCEAPYSSEKIVTCAHNLLNILNPIDTPEQLDLAAFEKESMALGDCLPGVGREILLPILISMLGYIKQTRESAHPDSLTILRSACQNIAQTTGQEDFFTVVQYCMGQYIEFQDSIVFPTIAQFSQKENEIKKILGLIA